MTISPLERLAKLVLENDKLMDQLSHNRERVKRLQESEVGTLPIKSLMVLENLYKDKNRILSLLRLNRQTALQILGSGGT